MYINFWYPIAKSEEVTNEAPYRTQLLCVNLVAFRDSDGKARVLSDTCIHRGGALGTGKIKDDCVEWMNCPKGQGLAVEGTISTDRVCRACVEGTFSSNRLNLIVF